MNDLIENLRNLGPRRLVILGLVAMGILGFFYFAATRITAQQMALLYADLDPQTAGKMVSQIESRGIPYELRSAGSQIFVPEEQVFRLRLTLAQEGGLTGQSVGYEIFDRPDTFSSTTFVQNINQLRALEGELARTIASLTAVQSARVHLVLPQRELFSRERQEPSGSVVLKMRGAASLEKGEVNAIQYVVSSAVPGLKPARVSIIDDRGTLLARGLGDGEAAQFAASNLDEVRRAYERRLTTTIEDLVGRTVGTGKVRAQVAADMDFDRITTNTESFDPDGQVVRSTQTINETTRSSEAQRQQSVTVANNLPDAQAQAGIGNASTNQSDRTEETVNYEVSRTTRTQVREAGLVKRLSVAVMIDNGVQRTQADIDGLTSLVRSAIGYDQQRGDTVQVVSVPFAPVELATPEDQTVFLGLSRPELFRAAEIAVLGIVAMLIMLLVVRPLLRQLFEPAEGVAEGAEVALLADEGVMTAAALAAPAPPPGAIAEVQDEIEQMIDINRVEGRVKASSLKKIGEIVEKHPEEAVSIVRYWMYQEA